MSNNTTHNAVFMGAAVVGVLGAIGMFIAEQFYANKRRVKLAQDVSRLNQQLASTRIELEHLKECMKECQKAKPKQRRPRRHAPPAAEKKSPSEASTIILLNGEAIPPEDTSIVSDTDYYTEYTESGDYESASDEFYDLSSEEETDNASSVRNGRRGQRNKGGLVDVISRADELLKGSTKFEITDAKTILLDEYSKSGEAQNADILWRLAKSCYKLAKLEGDCGNDEERKLLTGEGIDYATRALQADDKNFEVHKWYAILIGSQNDFVGTKEKIMNGQIFIKHINEAMKLNPQDANLYHLSGRFKLEVSGLSWFERKMAATLFGEVPMATYADAFHDFHKAEALHDVEWKENRLFLAQCCIGNGDYKEAVKWLKMASEIQTISADDEIAEQEIQKLLSTYRSYADS